MILSNIEIEEYKNRNSGLIIERANQIAHILNDNDPMGVFKCSERESEYSSEALHIECNLYCCDTYELTLTLVHSVFVYMFSPKMAGPREEHAKLAAEIFNLRKKNYE